MFLKRKCSWAKVHEKMFNTANRQRMPISAHTCQRGYRQRERKLQVLAKVWRKTSCIGDSVNRGSHHGNSMELSQKSESRITICSSSPTPRYISKKTKNMSSKNACTPIFIVALFTVAKIWKHLSVHQQMSG